jgi:hypothetical protein
MQRSLTQPQASKHADRKHTTRVAPSWNIKGRQSHGVTVSCVRVGSCGGSVLCVLLLAGVGVGGGLLSLPVSRRCSASTLLVCDRPPSATAAGSSCHGRRCETVIADCLLAL